MQQVPADIWAAFERRLDQAQVPADQRPDYHKWVRFYFDFCARPGGAIRLRNYSRKTLSAYRLWVAKFQAFVRSRPTGELGGQEVRGFLSDLAVRHGVAGSTQNQAFNALLFFYQESSCPGNWRRNTRTAKEFIWQSFFPAANLTWIAPAREQRRYHLHDSHVQGAVKQAATRAGIPKRVSPHIAQVP